MQNEIFSSYWWLSVVIVGILIILASAYIKPPLDDLMGKYSERWKLRVEKKRKTVASEINILLNDANMMTLAIWRQSQEERIGFFCLLSAMIFLVFEGVIAY